MDRNQFRSLDLWGIRMKVKEIEKFKEKILKISFAEMKDKEILTELTRLYVALGDFFVLIRLPKDTNLSIFEKQKYSKRREQERKKK